MKTRSRVLWRTKLLALLLVFALLPAVAVALIGLDTMGRTMEQNTLDGLEALARAKAEAVDQFTDIRTRDVERMAQLISPQLGGLRAAPTPRQRDPEPPPPEPPPEQIDDAGAIGPDGTPRPAPAPDRRVPPEVPAGPEAPPSEADRAVAAARADLSQKLGLLLWDQGAFEEIIVMDQVGLVKASTFREHTGKTAAPVEYFERGRRATYVQPVFQSPITGELTMVIATPIRDASNTEIGVLAARLNLKRFFRLINDFTGLGRSGETVVAKKIKDEIVFMAPTRHDADAALNRKIPVGSTVSRELQDAARGDSGRGRITDYRGVKVYAAWRTIPSLEWGLIAKIDHAEAAAPVRAARNRILALALLVAGLVVVSSIIAARALVRPLGELKEAADKISKGNFDVELDIRSGDEIGQLADSFERMVAAIKYFRASAQETPEADEVVEPDASAVPPVPGGGKAGGPRPRDPDDVTG
jgi:HAMP domain-containing protein